MNLTRIALVFVLITMPFMMMSYVDTMSLQKREQARQQYTQIIHNAVSDGTTALKNTTTLSDGDGLSKQLSIDAGEVVQGFLASYHYGFNALGERDKIQLDQHVLALVIIGYDGFWIYGTREVTEPSGRQVMKHVLSEKMPYLYEDSHYLMKVTLENDVTVLEKSTLLEVRGEVSTIGILPTAITVDNYDSQRQQIIRDAITVCLKETVSNHNRYAGSLGVIYDFYIPLGDGNRWSRAIKDVGFLAIVQGHPLGGGDTLDVVGFNQGNVMVQERIIGYQDGMGQLYYCDSSCTHIKEDPEVKVFSDAAAAALEGYYPCHMVGK